MRVMLDSMVHDLVVADEALLTLLNAKVAAGALTLLSTHVQHDELSRIPDQQKRDSVLSVPVTRTVTRGMIWDVSQWDECTWGDDEGAEILDHVMNGNIVHAEDALIGATADAAADVLVTQERRLGNRLRAAGSQLPIWTFEEFAVWLRLEP
jgi:hypothetical protein